MIYIFVIISCIFLSATGFSYFTKNRCFIDFAIICSVIMAISFLLPNIYLFFFLFVIVSFFILQIQKDNVYLYYIAILPFFPITLGLNIALPGIDTFFSLNHSRLLILCLMMPLLTQLLMSRVKIIDPIKSYTGIVDRLILFHLFLDMLIYFRDHSVLFSARYSLVTLVDIWLPYIVISRYVKNTYVVLVVVLFTACALALIALVEKEVFFRVYDALSLPLGDKFRLYKIRSGELRASASMANPLAVGFFFAICLPLAYRIRDLISCPFYVPWVLLIIILVGIDASGSRSPLFASVFGLLALFWWLQGRGFVQQTELLVGICVVAFCIWLFLGGIETITLLSGKDDTVVYRYELIKNSMHLISENFWFGTPPSVYLNDPIMLQSMQGEGIIDITNTYLMFLLKSGFFSLISFVAIWLFLFHGLCHSAGPDKIAAILMAVGVTIMVMLFITSMVSFVPLYSWLFIGLISGFIRQHGMYRST